MKQTLVLLGLPFFSSAWWAGTLWPSLSTVGSKGEQPIHRWVQLLWQLRGRGGPSPSQVAPQACSGLRQPTQKESELQSSTWPGNTFRAPAAPDFCFNPPASIILYQGLILSLYFLKLYCNTLCYILMHFASVIQKMNEMIYNSYLFLLLANSMLYSEKHSPRQVNIMYFSTVV